MRFINDIIKPLLRTAGSSSLVVLGLLLSLSASAQGWEKYYGGAANEEANAIIQMKDQGYALVGSTSNIGGDFAIYVQRTDVDGKLLWTSEINLPSSDEFGHSIVEDQEGNLVVTGQSNAGVGSIDVIVMKLDRFGNAVWPAPLFFGGNDNDRGYDIITTVDGGYLVVGSFSFQGQEDFYMIKLDVDGNLEWQRNFGQSDDEDILRAVVQMPNGDYMVTGSTGDNVDSQVYVARISGDGQSVVWVEVFGPQDENDIGYDIIKTFDDKYVIAGKTKNSSDYLAVKLDENGDSEFFVPIGTDDLEEARSIQQTRDGGYILGGFKEISPLDIQATLLKLNSEGVQEWIKEYGRSGTDIGNGVVVNTYGGYVLAGYTTLNIISEPTDILLIKSDSEGNQVLTNHIHGNVFYDFNDDCDYAGNEQGVKNWVVKAVGDKTFYGVTDENGDYKIPVETGQYELSVVRPNDYWQACSNFTVNFPVPYDTLTRYLGINPDPIQCEDLEVDVSTPFVKACEQTTYTVTYCNHGNIEADEPVVELTLSNNLEYISSDPTFTYQIDSLYGFEVSDLDIGECGSFTITVEASCDALLTETHCIKAHITPDNICLPNNPGWDGSSVAVNGYCDNDSVRFEINNVGTSATTLDYIVVEDIIMGLQSPNPPVLPAGETFFPEALPANGSTYRLIARQSEGHPGNSLLPTIAVEGCVAGGGMDYSTGYHTQLPEDDKDHFLATDCQENIPSTFDSQVKRGYPKGYGDSLKIASTTDLKYHIKFQNVGSDTAIRVVIRDTISPFLDPQSVRPGASSHDYDFEVYDNGVLKFTFDNIMLIDSSTNESASHGFVKYRITQKPDNPEGTLIKNGAAIFFDYQEPLTTDSVCNYVGGMEWTDFIILNDQVIYIPKTEIKIYPNPVSMFATFELEGASIQPPLDFEIYDVAGKLVRSERFYDTTFIFDRGHLSAGMYFYQISHKNQLISTGKIIAK